MTINIIKKILKKIAKTKSKVLAHLYNHKVYRKNINATLVNNESLHIKLTTRTYSSYRKDYTKYIEVLNYNIGAVIFYKKSKYLSWAAIATLGEEISASYLGKAVYLHPIAINDITTSIVVGGAPNSEAVYQHLKKQAEQSENYSHFIQCIILLKENNKEDISKLIKNEYFLKKMTKDEKVEIFSALALYNKVINLYEKTNNISEFSKSAIEKTYNAYTKLDLLQKAESLFEKANREKCIPNRRISREIDPHFINNKLERHFWFAKGDLEKAYSTYKRQNLSQVMYLVYGDKYIQSNQQLIPASSPLALASWGPGDEIRYSRIYETLSKRTENLTISCDSRLLPVLSEIHPTINFLPIPRTRRVKKEHCHLYNRLPHPKLHHIIDNRTHEKIDNYDKVFLITDLLGENIEEYINNSQCNTVTKFNIINEDAIAPLLKKKDEGYALIGISWRSSIMTSSRNEHYFTIEQLSKLFSLPNVCFVNLQYGNCSSELQNIKDKYQVEILDLDVDQYNDFEGVLVIMQKLDLIISAGTTVLELAGLSGTKTWALTNSKTMNYKINNKNQDIWFQNINYIENAYKLDKEDVVNCIINKINIYPE